MMPPLSPELLHTLETKGTCRKYIPNTIITAYGDYKTKTAFILDGILKASIDDPNNSLLLYHLESQKEPIIGFMNIYTNTPVNIAITSITNCTLLWVENVDLLDIGKKHIELRDLMINYYNTMNKNLLFILKNLLEESLEVRVLDYIKMKSQLHNTSNILVPRCEIAMDLNISRVTLSRVLKKLEHQELIQRNIKSITLKTTI